MKPYILAGAFLAGLPSFALAETKIYECTLDKKNGWMAAPVVIVHSESEQGAMAADPLIMHYQKNPIEVQVATNQANKKTFAWQLKIKDPSGQYATMKYRATIINGRQFAMSATPLGYENTYRGDGTCTVKVQK